MGDQSVQVGVGGSFDTQTSLADVIDGFIVKHKGNIGVFQEGMGGKHRVVRLNNSGRNLRGWVDAKVELGLLSVISRELFQQQRTKARSGSSTNRVKDQESLETAALVGNLSDSINGVFNDFLSDGVVSSGVVVGRILFAVDQLFRVEKLLVRSSSDFIQDGWFQINKDGSRDVLSLSGLGEEGVERVAFLTEGGVGGHLSVLVNSVFKAEQFPASITKLATSLSNMNINNFSHYY